MELETIGPLDNQVDKTELYKIELEWYPPGNNINALDMLILLDRIRDVKSLEWRHPRLVLFEDGSGRLWAKNALRRFQLAENGEDASNCPPSELEFDNLEDFLQKGNELLESIRD
jgi:hypothetical protein